jgi:hypothetical protein
VTVACEQLQVCVPVAPLAVTHDAVQMIPIEQAAP